MRMRSFSRCKPQWLHLLAALFIAVTVSRAMAQQTAVTTLARLRDQYRPLLIFAPGPNDPQLEIQIRTLQEHAAAVQDRNLAVIALPYQAPTPSQLQLSPADAEAARRRFGIEPDQFAVILLGKDGGQKLRSGKPLSMERLAKTIDAMPMRQDEMKAKGHV